ncbi:MAG: hypothetical protein JNJ65_00045 [Cyclobacteriaceae bacterium]|nr:hypothetical protein [Cyclobacteriaceae bacterium]
MNLILKSTLDDYGIPVLGIVINEKTFPAAIDTGSTGNVMRPDMVSILDLGAPDRFTKASNPMHGSFKPPTYYIEYRLEGRDDVTFRDPFIVMSTQDYPYPFLLGCDFLIKTKSFTIYGLERTFEVFL